MSALHETCQQYVARRLSEGWTIIWQRGYHLVLSSPDGNILRPVDLRNDVETLRPNEAGDYTNIASQEPDSTSHYDKVDEVEADEDTTYVYTPSTTQEKDAYGLEATGLTDEVINSVAVFFRVAISASVRGMYGRSQPFLRLGTDETAGAEGAHSLTGYATHPKAGAALARPGGGDWVVADLADLQVVIGLRHDGGAETRCTQVYVEVDYTPVTPAAPGSLAQAAMALLP